MTSARTTTLRSEKLPFQVVILNHLWESMVQFLLNLGVQTRVPYRAKGIWCGCISRATATPPLSTRGSRLPLKQVCVFPFNLVRNIQYHIYSCNYKLYPMCLVMWINVVRVNISSTSLVNKLVYRVSSKYVMAAILVSQNSETAAMLGSETNPVGSWTLY